MKPTRMKGLVASPLHRKKECDNRAWHPACKTTAALMVLHNPEDPHFAKLISAFREAQSSGGLGMRMKTISDSQVVSIFLRPSTDEAVASSLRKIRNLLALDSSTNEFTVTYGTYQQNSSEIAVQSGSILQVMIDLASYIDVPEKDLLEGRVRGGRRTLNRSGSFPDCCRCIPGLRPLTTVTCLSDTATNGTGSMTGTCHRRGYSIS